MYIPYLSNCVIDVLPLPPYSVDLDSLGPLLGQIVVALSPLVEEYADSVAEIFEFLIVEHRLVLIVRASLSEPHTSVVYGTTCIDRPTDRPCLSHSCDTDTLHVPTRTLPPGATMPRSCEQCSA